MSGTGDAKRGLSGVRAHARAIAASVVLGILPIAAIATAPAAEAVGLARGDYPTWDQVQQAQQAEDAAKTLIAQIQGQLTQLQADAKAAQDDAQAKGQAYGDAQNAYDTQDYKTQELQTQADAAEKDADAARQKAGQLASQLSKTNGGIDSTVTLLSHQGSADGQLYRLQAYNQLIKQSQGVYDHALQLQKNAQALTDQATVQKRILADLEQKAQAAFAVAQDAAKKAQDALAAQQAHQAQMQAQLTVLTQNRAATQADYEAGLVAQWGPGAAGRVSASGWADPANGELLDPFGMRFHPIYKVWQLHTGQDIANSCGSPIFAAHSGTVIYAGWYSDLGNYIQIREDDGTITGYGHIINGGILVSMGQHVGPGQNIAKIGSTGGSTGCHLHFQVWVDGSLTDPVAFMRDRGVTLGS